MGISYQRNRNEIKMFITNRKIWTEQKILSSFSKHVHENLKILGIITALVLL